MRPSESFVCSSKLPVWVGRFLDATKVGPFQSVRVWSIRVSGIGSQLRWRDTKMPVVFVIRSGDPSGSCRVCGKLAEVEASMVLGDEWIGRATSPCSTTADGPFPHGQGADV